MNNPSGMNQAEMLALMGMLPTSSVGRAGRRQSVRHGDDNKPKFDREKRNGKRRSARKARARNRR